VNPKTHSVTHDNDVWIQAKCNCLPVKLVLKLCDLLVKIASRLRCPDDISVIDISIIDFFLFHICRLTQIEVTPAVELSSCRGFLEILLFEKTGSFRGAEVA
jgi:hypothetical protein